MPDRVNNGGAPIAFQSVELEPIVNLIRTFESVIGKPDLDVTQVKWYSERRSIGGRGREVPETVLASLAKTLKVGSGPNFSLVSIRAIP